jgi:hypothetical protein
MEVGELGELGKLGKDGKHGKGGDGGDGVTGGELLRSRVDASSPTAPNAKPRGHPVPGTRPGEPLAGEGDATPYPRTTLSPHTHKKPSPHPSPCAQGEGLCGLHFSVKRSFGAEWREGWEVNFPNFPGVRIRLGEDSVVGLVPPGGAAVRGEPIELPELPELPGC